MAAATVIRDHGQDSMGVDLLRSNGFTMRDLLDAGVDDYDIQAIRKALYGKEL